MEINVENFKSFLKKATFNFSIESVQIIIDGDRIQSKMINEEGTAIVNLDVENNVFTGIEDKQELNFSLPFKQLIPFLNLLDEEEADIKLNDEKMVIISGRQKSNIHFCSPQIVTVFGADSPRSEVKPFLVMDIDENFISSFNKIKKIGQKFGKIYFTVDNNSLIMETEDKINRFSNSLKFNLIDKLENETDNLILEFKYKNMTDLMTLVSDEGFKLSLFYIKDQEMGMAHVKSLDGCEKYFLMSKMET